jgi:TBC1 domain family member 10
MSTRFKTTSPSTVSSHSLPNSKMSDTISISSSVSAFSSGVPDRYGFFGGTQVSNKPKVPLTKAQILAREKKWLHMLDHW